MKHKRIRRCIQCDDVVIGRSDKKYCCDDCRTAYHNALNKDSNTHVKNINRILKNNRRILVALLKNGNNRTSENRLRNSGFQFPYFTHFIVDKSGKQCTYCYDVGYCRDNHNTLTLLENGPDSPLPESNQTTVIQLNTASL